MAEQKIDKTSSEESDVVKSITYGYLYLGLSAILYLLKKGYL